ncbi:chemotaxis protein [Clostridium acetobutylicum]|nr:chemotaxis protein [Clostridium acetobutylicum]
MRWYDDMKISSKILVGFVVIIFISAVSGVFGILNLNKVNNSNTETYEKMLVPTGELVSISNDFGTMRARVRDVVIETQMDKMDKFSSDFNAASSDFDKVLESFSQTILTADGKTILSEIKDAKKEYVQYAQQVMELSKQNKNVEAMAIVRNQLTVAHDKLATSIKNVTDMKKELAKESTDQNSATAKTSIIETIILVILGAGFGVAMAVLTSRSIGNPMKKITEVSEKIADGELDVELKTDRKDEIGVLMNSFNKMVSNLNLVMSSMNTAADQVAIGSKQVSDSSIMLSQGSSDQASAVEELTSSMEEIASQTKVNANNATEASELGNEVKSNAEKGNNQMKQMLNSMDDINAASKNISKIIKVIDDIAFQTNILSLNAAVEAARAGQYGKGFAVVAEEVRNLAAKSANAARETTEMIENSIRKVETGTEFAKETAAALDEIVQGISKSAQLLDNIASSSNEQAIAIDQINKGIVQVSSVVQDNSATSEETAAASEELASQASLLKNEISKFKLKGKGGFNYGENYGMEHAATKGGSKTYEMSNMDMYGSDFGKY